MAVSDDTSAHRPLAFEDHLMRAQGLVNAIATFAMGLDDERDQTGLYAIAVSLQVHMDVLQEGFEAVLRSGVDIPAAPMPVARRSESKARHH